ncbi:MAG TPA: PfkB family carbohydrate kinase [Terrimesophilobacter sp.]|nr:PfkB family carbohydrate kinase [Terrimesophilobacter sp.]
MNTAEQITSVHGDAGRSDSVRSDDQKTVHTDAAPTSKHDAPQRPGRVVVFAPSPELTITIEDHAENGDIHIHAGGQGVWQARMARALRAEVTLCATFAGETGKVLQHLLADEGINFVAVKRPGLGAAYIHDRRGGERQAIIETAGDPLSRHDLDELYGITLREGIESDVVILSGPVGDGVLPADVYRRLAADLREHDCTVIIDLAGERLDAALEGGVDVVKVSHEELLADGRITDHTVDDIVEAMRGIRDAGAGTVIVTRAEEPLLLLTGDDVRQLSAPTMEIVDTRGAGDSFTAATAVGLARGLGMESAAALGASAGALNVTRHGLGTGDADAIHTFASRVRMSALGAEPHHEVEITPDELAAMAQ